VRGAALASEGIGEQPRGEVDPKGRPTAFGPLRPLGGRRLAAVGAGVVAGAGVLALYYVLSRHLVPGTSDSATVVLEGSAMAHGNVALHGWSLSLDSFWLVDALFYALGVLAFGLGPALIHLVPAVLALLAAASAAALAAAGERGAAALAGALTTASLLAFPSPELAYFLLQGPWHVGTALFCLVAFAALAEDRVSWRSLVGVVLLTAAMLGDLFALELGALPVLAAGLARMARHRRLRPGASQVGAAVLSIGLAVGGRAAAAAAGGFRLVNRNVVLQLGQIETNVSYLANRVPALLGVKTMPIGPRANGAVAFQVLHVAGLGLVLVAVLAALWRLGRGVLVAPRAGEVQPGSFLDDCLVVGVLLDLVLFVLGAGSDNPEYAKYLTPGVVFATVLAGRTVARFVAGGGLARLPRALGAGLVTGAALLVAAFAAESIADIGPAAAQPAVGLGRFLAAHHLTRGIGDYWSASIVTVETHGAVVVRPVTTGFDERLHRYDRQSAVDWYRSQAFQFFVYNTAKPWRQVNATTAERTFGAPAATYAVGTYRVLVWRKPVSVGLYVPTFSSPLQFYLR